MGMSAERRAELDAEIAALVPEEKQPDPDKPMCKHGCATIPCRHTRTEDKHKKHVDRGLRGVPLVGAGQGAIAGTVPGPGASGRALDDEARELNEHARLIVAARMKAARKRLRQPGDQT